MGLKGRIVIMKVCVIGGVAGGATVVTRLRRLDEAAEIVLFEKGGEVSYANCGMPYYLGGQISDREKLIVTKPELLLNRFNIDLRLKNEVIALDPKAHTLRARELETGREYEEHYDKLVVSTGAAAKLPPVPGADGQGIFTLRSIADMYKIDDYISAHGARRALVVGAGFIGVEMAENLQRRGLQVTLAEFANQILAPLDLEMANILHREMIDNDVDLRLSTGAAGFEQLPGGEIEARLTDGKTLRCDLVILSLGVTPETKLAADAGLRLSMANTIATDDRFRTSDPDIYAVGDAISVQNGVTGEEMLVQLAGPANRQARAAADDICGIFDDGVKKAIGTSVVKVYDYTAASTGMNEKQLKKAGIPYRKTYATPASHAGYYPNAKPIVMKLLFADDGRVLGAQAVGQEYADKQIDTIAAVIHFGGTVRDLEQLELGYGPAYNSAKSNVNMLGFTAANMLDGLVKVFYAEDMAALDPEKAQLVDVSTPDEILMSGVLPGAISIPLDELRARIGELDPTKPTYVACPAGQRGYIAARFLSQRGFEVYNLSGGTRMYGLVNMELDKVREHHAQMKARFGRGSGAPAAPAPAPAVPARTLTVDACGLQCPGPIMKVSEAMKTLSLGDRLTVKATDPAFAADIDAWCSRTGNALTDLQRESGVFSVTVQKGTEGAAPAPAAPSAAVSAAAPAGGNDKTMIVFDGDLDKAIAAFIIANGAVAMERKVTMFFTFWGLNILRKGEGAPVSKTAFEKMFSGMMPKGSTKLKLSKMNMAGAGGHMIRDLMKKKNVPSLEELIGSAIRGGVRVVACQMSMDLMGIKKEELIDGVEIGGVATFLGAAETSDTTLFI